MNFRCGALLLALTMSSCTCAPRPLTVARTTLAKLPDDVRKGSLAIDEDQRDVAFAQQTPDGVRLVHRGVAGPPYSDIAQPRLAPGTDAVFYWAMNQTGGEGVRDIFLIANEQPIPIVPPIARPMKIVFTPSGSRWAVIAGTEPGPDGQPPSTVRAWVDGQFAGEYPDMSQPTFSSDGTHVAVLVDAGGGRIGLLVDGKQERVFDTPARPAVPRIQPHAIGPNMPEQFSISYLVSGELLILTSDRDGWSVYRGERRLASYPGNEWQPSDGPRMDFGGVLAAAPSIAAASLTAASAAPVVAWWARDGGADGRWRVVRDSAPESPTCARPGDAPALSTDGRHLAYACYEKPAGEIGKVSVIHDGHTYGPYDAVWSVAISPDGRHVAFAADGGAEQSAWFYVVDGKRYRLQFDQAFPPRFSPDGRHVAWVAKHLRSDGRPAKYLLFVDGSSVASSDEVVTGPRFADDGALSWVALRGKRLSRIEAKR